MQAISLLNLVWLANGGHARSDSLANSGKCPTRLNTFSETGLSFPIIAAA
jgi:hypothetical protein